MTPIQTWLKNMRQIWLEKLPNDIADLLADTLEYHESPTEPPLLTKQEIVDAWQEIKGQNIEYVEINILSETTDTGMAQWIFKMKNEPEHIGAYFLKLDNHGKCVHFRQWWNVKESD